MHRFVLLLALAPALLAQNQPKPPETLRGVLLEQLRSTHDKADWFVPIDVAMKDVTAEQAKWTDGKGNHSIGQLVNHLAFWDERALQRFKGEKETHYSGNNDDTFNNFDAKSWAETAARIDQVMKAWEQAVEQVDDDKLKANASLIAHIGAHNAYHIGQIVYIRKLQGSWNPANGVK